MPQVIIGVFLLFGFVMVVLLFFMIVFTAALLIFARRDKKQNKEMAEGKGEEASYVKDPKED